MLIIKGFIYLILTKNKGFFIYLNYNINKCQVFIVPNFNIISKKDILINLIIEKAHQLSMKTLSWIMRTWGAVDTPHPHSSPGTCTQGPGRSAARWSNSHLKKKSLKEPFFFFCLLAVFPNFYVFKTRPLISIACNSCCAFKF